MLRSPNVLDDHHNTSEAVPDVLEAPGDNEIISNVQTTDTASQGSTLREIKRPSCEGEHDTDINERASRGVDQDWIGLYPAIDDVTVKSCLAGIVLEWHTLM